MIDVSTLKTRIEAKLGGGSTNNVRDFFGKLRDAGSIVLSKIDPDTTIRTMPIIGGVSDYIDKYLAPDDIKSPTKIIELSDYSEYSYLDPFYVTFPRVVDDERRKYYGFSDLLSMNIASLETINGQKYLRLGIEPFGYTRLLALTGLEDDALWANVAGAENVRSEIYSPYLGSSRLFFDIATGTSATIETASIKYPFTLSISPLLGAMYLSIRVPQGFGKHIASVGIRFGSDTDNFSATLTYPYSDKTFQDGLNIVRIPMRSLVVSGTPTWTTANAKVQITINKKTGSETQTAHDVILEQLYASDRQNMEIKYYSSYLFRSIDGVWKKTPTEDSDVLMLDDEAEVIFVAEVMKLIAPEQQGERGKADFEYYNSVLGTIENEDGLYWNYVSQHPSYARPQNAIYHRF